MNGGILTVLVYVAAIRKVSACAKYVYLLFSTHGTSAKIAEMASKRITIGKSKVVFEIPDDIRTYGYAPEATLRLSRKRIGRLGWQLLIAPIL